MRRRRFLEASGALATLTLAGCTSAIESAASPPPTTVTVADGAIETTLTASATLDTISYYDEPDDTVRELEPSRDEWVTAHLYVTNNGGSNLPIDDVDDLTVGDGIEETVDLPVPEGSLREGAMMHPQRQMDRRGEHIPAGYSNILTFLFDAPEGPHGFEWSYGGRAYPLVPEE